MVDTEEQRSFNQKIGISNEEAQTVLAKLDELVKPQDKLSEVVEKLKKNLTEKEMTYLLGVLLFYFIEFEM